MFSSALSFASNGCQSAYRAVVNNPIKAAIATVACVALGAGFAKGLKQKKQPELSTGDRAQIFKELRERLIRIHYYELRDLVLKTARTLEESPTSNPDDQALKNIINQLKEANRATPQRLIEMARELWGENGSLKPYLKVSLEWDVILQELALLQPSSDDLNALNTYLERLQSPESDMKRLFKDLTTIKTLFKGLTIRYHFDQLRSLAKEIITQLQQESVVSHNQKLDSGKNLSNTIQRLESIETALASNVYSEMRALFEEKGPYKKCLPESGSLVPIPKVGPFGRLGTTPSGRINSSIQAISKLKPTDQELTRYVDTPSSDPYQEGQRLISRVKV